MKVLALFFAVQVVFASSANILGIFQLPYYSVSKHHEDVIKVLLYRGHNVTIITEIPFKPHENLTEIKLSESENLLALSSNENQLELRNSLLSNVELFREKFEMFMRHLKSEKIQNFIQSAKRNDFDLIISDNFFFNPLMALSEVFDCPMILSSASETFPNIHSMMGNEVNPIENSYQMPIPVLPAEMTIRQKLGALFLNYGAIFLELCLKFYNANALKKFFPNQTATQSDIENRVSLVMTNTHPAMGLVRPSSSLLHIGFLGVRPPKPLPVGDLKNFMDNSKTGVIYVSFGGANKASKIDRRIIQNFLNFFNNASYDVVWQIDDNRILSETSDNIFLIDWVPQADLLAHPNLKLFISQGGMHSFQEAIDRVVPMILFPFYYDQFFCATSMQQKGCGVTLDPEAFTAEELEEAIKEVLKPDCKKSLEKLREIIYDEPMTSQEKVAWWVEYIIRYKGAKHLFYHGRNVPLYEKYCLDLIAVPAGTLIILVVIGLLVRKNMNRNV